MLASWVVDEMKDADLRDKRLNDRLQHILSDLSERPTASVIAHKTCNEFWACLANH